MSNDFILDIGSLVTNMQRETLNAMNWE